MCVHKQEKLEKRAVVVATVLRKFSANFYAGRQQMIDAARAAAAAKKVHGHKGLALVLVLVWASRPLNP